jgi:hypothetical protein
LKIVRNAGSVSHKFYVLKGCFGMSLMVTSRKLLVKLNEQLIQPCATEVSLLTLSDGSKRLSIRRIAGKKRHDGVVFTAEETRELRRCLEALDTDGWESQTQAAQDPVVQDEPAKEE